MRIAITGATGIIGRNLCHYLSAGGHQISATGRDAGTGKELESDGISFIAADITERSSLDRVFAGCDLAIHCAALAGEYGSRELFHQVNVVGTENVIQSCRKSGVSAIIALSTPSIYFNGRDRLHIKESDPLPERQLSLYGKTKLEADRLLLASAAEDLSVILLRPRAVYGPHDRIIIPKILAMAHKGPVPLINGGTALVDITWIDNLLHAVGCCLEAPETAWNQVYNISNGEPAALRAWFSSIYKALQREHTFKSVPKTMAMAAAVVSEALAGLPFGNRKPQLTRFSVGYMAHSMTLNLEKAERLLDYSPVVDNETSYSLLAQQWNMPEDAP